MTDTTRSQVRSARIRDLRRRIETLAAAGRYASMAPSAEVLERLARMPDNRTLDEMEKAVSDMEARPR